MTQRDIVDRYVDGYFLEAMIGRGTVGVVYRALTAAQEPVALKLCVPPLNGDVEMILTRFNREARTVARLHHPHIVPVLDTGTMADQAYMAMPLIKGESLADRLQREHRLDEMTTIEIGWQVADALFHAAEKGVIHRDVKPSNVLVSPDGHTWLTDFGIAFAFDDPSLTQAGHILGTPAYLAPEQARQDKLLDGRTDLYGLGVMLYQMVTGRLPFQGTTFQMIHAHVYETPPAPSTLVDICPGLERIIMTALAKDPADRFPDGRTMARELLSLNEQYQERKPPVLDESIQTQTWSLQIVAGIGLVERLIA